MAQVKIYNTGGSGGGGGTAVILADTGTNSSVRCGVGSCASANYSFAVGKSNTASGIYSTALNGYSNNASGAYSTASGRATTASAYFSTASGQNTTASGRYSTASGCCTTASGNFSTASGQNTTASGYYSTASGLATTASGYCYASVHNGLYNHIGNSTCSAYANYGVVVNGNANNTTGGTWSATYWSVAPTPVDSGCHSFIGNGFQNSASCNYSSVLNGKCNTASGQYSIASGVSTTASGTYSIASGVATTASGFGSVSLGNVSTSSGCYSIANGDLSTANGDFSTASGRYATAIGHFSTASGYCTTASGRYSIASGYYACACQFGQRSWANGSFSTAPNAQQVQYLLRNTTPNATPLNLYLDGDSTEISIKTNSVMMLNINTIGIETDGAPVGSSQVYAIIKNVAGTTSIIHQNVIADHYGVVGLAVTISANNTTDTLQIQVTGTANTMRWVSYVNGVEILYAT